MKNFCETVNNFYENEVEDRTVSKNMNHFFLDLNSDLNSYDDKICKFKQNLDRKLMKEFKVRLSKINN